MPDVRSAAPRGRWILLTTVLGSSMAMLDSTVVNVALPRIGRGLDADLAALQWTVNGGAGGGLAGGVPRRAATAAGLQPAGVQPAGVQPAGVQPVGAQDTRQRPGPAAGGATLPQAPRVAAAYRLGQPPA
jgi:hypothetical protein